MKEMEYGTAPVDHNQQVICMISTASVPATALLVTHLSEITNIYNITLLPDF